MDLLEEWAKEHGTVDLQGDWARGLGTAASQVFKFKVQIYLLEHEVSSIYVFLQVAWEDNQKGEQTNDRGMI